MTATRTKKRDGFSLLEIMLSLAILGGSLAVLSRIMDTGVSAAIESRSLAQARLACQAKLSEVLMDAGSGIQPQTVISVPMESFDSSSTSPMYYSVEVAPASIDGLLAIRVSVEVQNGAGTASIASYSLTRWAVDPALGLEQAEAEEQAAFVGETDEDEQ
jgi:prepilin-type N-terminal cleavage/methylation domain-containing protein